MVHEQHQHETQQQRDKRRVEGDAQALGHAGDVALDCLVCEPERVPDSANGSDESDRRDRPDDVSDHRQLGFLPLGFGLADGLGGGGDVANVSRGCESVEPGQKTARQECPPGGRGQRLANLGRCLTCYLAGGTGGLRHYFEQFGRAMKEQNWTRHQPPGLTEALIPRLRG